jgi:hypothetical protein
LLVHLPVKAVPPRQPSRADRGSTMIELALILSVALPLLLGVTGVGMRLGWTLSGTQLTRDVAHMYALGTDFNQTGAVSIAQKLSTDFSLTNTGTAVLILSKIVQVYQADCTAASLQTCPNLNEPVFAQRIYLGNTKLRASNYGTPDAWIKNGVINSSDYLVQSALIANGFSSVMTLADGQIAYLTEGYFSMPQLDLLDPTNSQQGGYYVRFVF